MSAASPSRRPSLDSHRRSVRLLHTSDVHVGRDVDGAPDRGSLGSLQELQRLIGLVQRLKVDLLLITGDFFDHNRIDTKLATRTAALLESASIAVVILPGNHDPYTVDSVYRRQRFPRSVHIVTSGTGELIALPEFGVQIWGQAHTDYMDFAPLGAQPAWMDQPHDPLWRVVAAHGLFVRSDYETRLSYRIHDHQLEALQAHYVGLGHLEQHEQLDPFAYYAGAPDRTGGATVVDLTPNGISVRHAKFDAGAE